MANEMTKEETELLNLYNSLSDKEAAQMTPDEMNHYESLLDKSKGVSTDSDLYSKALQVGYSGLSKDDQSKLDYAYAKSQASKTKSLDQVHAEMDANAAASRQMAEQNKDDDSGFKGWVKYVLPEMPKAGYQAARDAIAPITSPIIGSLEYLTNKGLGSFGQVSSADYNREYPETIKSSYEAAKKGEGLTGMAADPMNVVGSWLGKARALGELGALAGESTLGKLGSHAIEGAGLGAGQAYFNNGTGSDIVVGGILGGGLHPLTSYVLPADQAAIDKFKEQAIREFPGSRYFAIQANKAGLHAEEGLGAIKPEQKLEILKAVSDKAKGTPSIDDWIDYNRDIQNQVKSGYQTANDKIEQFSKAYEMAGEIPPTTVEFDDLKEQMIDNISKGIGPYTKAEAKKFVEQKLSGWKEKFGDKIPVTELGRIKSDLNNDIFDPRFTVAEGTTNKRNMARKAGSVISDIWKEKNILSPISRDANGDIILGHISYNDLLPAGTKEAFKTSEVLGDIFEKQRIPTASQRTAAGENLLERAVNGILSGGKKVYKSTGDAYGDPINLYRKYEKGPSPIAGSILGIVPTVGSETPLAVRKKIENKKTK